MINNNKKMISKIIKKIKKEQNLDKIYNNQNKNKLLIEIL